MLGSDAFFVGGESVFAVLDRFAGELGAQDFAGITQSQQRIDGAIDAVVGSQQKVGAQANLIEQAGAFSEAMGFGARGEQGRVTDADFAQSLSQLRASRTSYEASLRLEQEMQAMTNLVLKL